MMKDEKSKSMPVMNADEWTSAWMEGHLADLKRYASGPGILYESLIIGFVVGLVAHVGGYLLLSPERTGIGGLMADLLHALGWSLWTGVIVALFVQVMPELKRRQIRQAIAAFESRQRAEKRA